MPEKKSIADIVGAGADLQAHEAVAIAQQLITSAEVAAPADAEVGLTPAGRLTLSDVWLGSDGSVTCRACSTTPTVVEMGRLITEMLARGGHTRVPGGLRYTVARALLEVDAPRFDSIAQFSAALERYENGDRNVVLRELYARTAGVASHVTAGERRQRTPSVVALRRQLREADERLYLHLASRRTVANVPIAVPQLEPAAIELIPELRPERSIPSVGLKARRWVVVGVAVAVMTLAAGYIVKRMTAHTTDSPPTETRSPAVLPRTNESAPPTAPPKQIERAAPFAAETNSARQTEPAAVDAATVEPNDRITSIYTPLSGQRCTAAKEDNSHGSVAHACPGVAGRRLLVAVRDDRVSVTVVTPDAREHPLDYWNVIAARSSRLGQLAEWRVVYRDGKATPLALIARVYADGDSRRRRNTSYLTVTKLTANEICVTDRIPAGTGANEQARRAADASAGRACLHAV